MKYTIEYDIILLSGEGIPKSCVMSLEELNLDVIKSAIALEKNVTEVKIIKIIPNKPDSGLKTVDEVNLLLELQREYTDDTIKMREDGFSVRHAFDDRLHEFNEIKGLVAELEEL